MVAAFVLDSAPDTPANSNRIDPSSCEWDFWQSSTGYSLSSYFSQTMADRREALELVNMDLLEVDVVLEIDVVVVVVAVVYSLD